MILRKSRLVAWGIKKALQGSNFASMCHALKAGLCVSIIFVCKVYKCAKEELKLNGN